MKGLKFLIKNFEKITITLLMFIMVILIFVQVFSRYVLGDATAWSEEAARYFFIWLIFLSVGIGFTEKRHIGIDIIIDRLSLGAQKILKQIVYLLLLGIVIFFTYQGFLLVQDMMGFGQSSASMQIPMWVVYLSLPIGFLLATLRLIQSSVNLWKEEDNIVDGEGQV